MTEPRLFTRKEVAGLEGPAVFIIHNVVYDVSSFLDEHPGGREVLTRVAGREASEDFDEIGHSSDAKELMKKYAIGEVVPEDRVDVTKNEFKWEDVKHSGSEGFGWQLPLLAVFAALLLWLYFV